MTGNEKKSKTVYTGIGAATAAALIILSAIMYPFGTGSSSSTFDFSESNSVIESEVFEITPVTNSVESIQMDVTSESRNVTPETSDVRSALDVPDLLAPLIQKAYAVNATQNSVTLQEWQSLPTGTNSIAYDATNDDIWFSGHGTNRINRLDLTTGTLTRWPVLSGTDNSAIALDPTGRVYFTMGAEDKVGRLDPTTNSIIEWFLPGGFGPDFLAQIAFDPISGHVVYNRPSTGFNFADQRIGKLNPSSNQITEWINLCTGGTAVAWCVERFGLDPVNGDIYFGLEVSNTINRIRPSTPTVVTSWAIPQPSSNPIGVTVTSSNTVYAALNGGNRILRLETAGANVNQITQWLVPTAGNQPFAITTRPDGAVYFTEYNAGKIGRIVPSSNLFTEWSLAAGIRPTQIITDPSGNLYWSVDNAGRIGRLT